MALLAGITTAILTTGAIRIFNRIFMPGKIMYDVSRLLISQGSINLDFLVTNYSGNISKIQLKRVELHTVNPNGSTSIVTSQDLNFDTIRLIEGEAHRFINTSIDTHHLDFEGEPLFRLIALVDQREVTLNPYQFYNNLAVYDENRAAAYTDI